MNITGIFYLTLKFFSFFTFFYYFKRFIIYILQKSVETIIKMPQLPIEFKLQNQIQKRINENELSKNDLDFYQRKIRRLQNQLNISQEQVSKLRVKLKRAEDFEFKYELVFKQFNDLKNENDLKIKELNVLKGLNQELKMSLEQKTSNIQDFSYQKSRLMEQISRWKQRFQQVEHQSRIDLQDQKLHSQSIIKQNEEKIRSQYKQRQQDMQYEIHQLKKIVLQKQTVQSIINQRVDKLRKSKDEQIQRLKQITKQTKLLHETYMRQKNQQLERMKQKFQKMINFDIQNLKHNRDDQEEIFSIELNGLRQMISLKNDEIQKLLTEVKRMATQHQINRRQLLKQITILKEKIYTVQNQANIELQNLKDRLIAIHAQDLKSLEERHEKIIDTLKKDLDESRKYIKQLERMQQNMKNQGQRIKSEFRDRLKQKDKRISELLDNLRDRGQVNASQLKSLHQSFHLITTEKQGMETQYQSNVTFLNQQIAKLSNIGEIKTKQITKLHQQIHHLKQSYEQRLLEYQARYRKQRKQYQDEKQKERLLRDQINQKLQDQERIFKNQLRQHEREVQKLTKQKSKLEYVLAEAQKDIERLNKYIKQMDDSLKNQFKKSQLSILDKDSLRRQIISELEKQKVQLEAMKLMQIDQMRKKYQIENARLIAVNQQLKTQILNKSIAFDNLESEFKKLDYRHRNADKLQKDKIREYEQKMITLTQEIGITSNLYKTFLEAKARAEQ